MLITSFQGNFFMRATCLSLEGGWGLLLCCFGIQLILHSIQNLANISHLHGQSFILELSLLHIFILGLLFFLHLLLLFWLILLSMWMFEESLCYFQHINVRCLLVLHCIFEGLPLVIDVVSLKRSKCAFGGINFVLKESTKLSSIAAEAKLGETAQDTGDSHVIVEGSEKGLMETLLVVRMPRSTHLPCCLTPQSYPQEPQYHCIGEDVSLQHFQVGLEGVCFLEGEWLGVDVEAGLEGVGEEPLDEGVVLLQSLIISLPLCMHGREEHSSGLRGRLVQIEFHVQPTLRLLLFLADRRGDG